MECWCPCNCGCVEAEAFPLEGNGLCESCDRGCHAVPAFDVLPEYIRLGKEMVAWWEAWQKTRTQKDT